MNPKKLRLTPENPPAPGHLSEESRRLWDEIVSEFEIRDAPGLAILASGLESRDRADEARRLLDVEGLTVAGSRGGTRAHPAVTIERDSRAAWLQALKLLNCQPEPVINTRRR
jgi:hypothetical protein